MFARYTGPDKQGQSFIRGKVYVSESDSDGETVDISILRLRDEDGQLVQIDLEQERFVYLEENYAAVVNPFDEFEQGEVLTVSGVSDDHRMYDVVGYGYRSIEDLVLMDRTNVTPSAVFKAPDGAWRRVQAVDECLSITFEGEGIMRDLSSVIVAISDGDVMLVPVLTCVDADGDDAITKDRKYLLVSQRGNLCEVADDTGHVREFFMDRFIFG